MNAPAPFDKVRASGTRIPAQLLRALTSPRLPLARALAQSGVEPNAAILLADVSLLAALAAELLDLGGSDAAIESAITGEFAKLRGLLTAVQVATGLPLPKLPGRAADWSGPHRIAFLAIRDHDDPFAVLGQELRNRSLTISDGEITLRDDDSRRDSGGYYTPFKLARRLTESAIARFPEETVPTILDPACGAGTFLSAAFDSLHEQLQTRRKEHPDQPIEPVAWAIAALYGVEMDPVALWAARFSLAVRAVRADGSAGGAGQMRLFGQSATYGPLIADRLRLGDALTNEPQSTVAGTERLSRRLLARDEPGRLPANERATPITWDVDFPLRFSDEEGAFLPGGFDLVLTNPPFVPIDRIPAERRRELQASLSTLQRRFDLFIGFVERARALLTQGGRASLLIPRTFLTETNAEKCRRRLLETASLERIEELGPVKFDSASVDCIMLTFAARRSTETTAIEIRRVGARKDSALLQSQFRRTPRAMFRLELTDAAAEECLLLAARSVPLGRYFCASWGARGSPVRDFHLDAPGHPLAKPMIKGDDVEPFRVRPPSRWLLYDPERLYRPSLPAMFDQDKIVVRKVTGASGVVCAVDRDGNYTDDSLACVVRKAGLISLPLATRRRHRVSIAPSQIEPSRQYDLDLVAAVLQTRLVQTYYRIQLGGGLNVFPELIESLPLPKLEMLQSPDAVELARMGRDAHEGKPFDADSADRCARRLFQLDARSLT